VTKHFFSLPQDFILATRAFFLQQEKKILCHIEARKKKKTVMSLMRFIKKNFLGVTRKKILFLHSQNLFLRVKERIPFP